MKLTPKLMVTALLGIACYCVAAFMMDTVFGLLMLGLWSFVVVYALGTAKWTKCGDENCTCRMKRECGGMAIDTCDEPDAPDRLSSELRAQKNARPR